MAVNVLNVCQSSDVWEQNYQIKTIRTKLSD